VPDFGEEREDAHTDFNDLAYLSGGKAVVDAIAAASEADALFEKWLLTDPHTAHSPTVVKELAALKQSDAVFYERLLVKLKKAGVRTGPLDREVRSTVKSATPQTESQRTTELYPHWEVEAWPEPVETDVLVRAITEQITRYVATLDDRAIVPALWVMVSYVHDLASHSPLLMVTSPEADSGKTTLLGVIGYLARRALLTVDISGPGFSDLLRNGSRRLSSTKPIRRS
jgi:hypothetical protein